MDDAATTRRSPHDDLHYIRQTLAAAGHISTVPGKGLALIGLLALIAAAINFQFTGAPWDSSAANAAQVSDGLRVWLALLAASLSLGALTMRAKARRTHQAF
ncbi:MAG: hypothetical protein ACREF9_16965, partial [Opitutaceae bacterium]